MLTLNIIDFMVPKHPAQIFIMNNYLLRFFIMFTFSAFGAQAQQQYSANSVMNCSNSDQTGPSPAFLYSCSRKNPSCQAILIFRAQTPYVSVSSISNLTSSDPSALAHINNISSSEVLPQGKEVLVPVTCSCSGQYYQANTSYASRPVDNTYFTIANNTYQGLTTCNALMRENPYGELDLFPGLTLKVPLRCACPTKKQIANGTRILLTYLVTWGDTIPKISKKFNVSARSVALANGFAEDDPDIYPFTTILIPLAREPAYPTGYLRKHRRSYKGICVGIGSGAATSVLCFMLFLGYSYYRKKRREAASRNTRHKQILPEHFLDKVVRTGEILKKFTYDELKAATENFSQHKKLGDSTYHGILRDKLSVIKKMKTDVSKEIKVLGSINHFNVISLYGVCEHRGIFYLVYEYMEEGTLRDWLHRENESHEPSWKDRVLIALDVANGLDYLHNFITPSYVHKDISSRNILLNGDLRAKIANFCLARENGNSHTRFIIGERGYMAPEYIQAGKVSPKVDVYAFGIVLLELITGSDAIFLRDGKEVHLSEILLSTVDGKNMGADINDLIDPRLLKKHPLGYIIDQSEVALRLLKLSAECLVREPANRISMAEVVSALMKILLDVNNSQSFSVG